MNSHKVDRWPDVTADKVIDAVCDLNDKAVIVPLGTLNKNESLN